jgi:predicted amino acid dehydrogenase
VGLVSYPLTPDMLREFEPSLAELDDDRLLAYARRSELLRDLPAYQPVRFDSPQGTSVDLTVYPLLVTQQQLREYQVSGQTFLIGLDLDRRVRAAKADGCDTVGLGFGLGAVSGHGGALRVPGVTVTTGSALAVGSALDAMRRAATERFGALDELTLAVIGGGGHIGSAIGALSARQFARIVLVGSGRPGSAERLRAAERRIYQESWERIAAGGELTGIPAALSTEPIVAGWRAEGRPGDEPSGEAIAAYLDDAYDINPFVVVADDPLSVRNAHVVFSAHSSPVPVLDEKYLADGAIVSDLSFFGTGAETAAVAGRDDLRYVRGGVLSVPGPDILPRGISRISGISVSLNAGELLAGAAEAVALTLSGAGGAMGNGAITHERVDAIVDLAKQHGFETIST